MKLFVINFLNNMNLKRKLIITYTLFVSIVVLTTGLLNYHISIRRVESSEKMLLLQNLKQTGALIDFNLEMYMKKSEIIFSNTIIQTALGVEYKDFSEMYDAYQNKIYRILEPIVQDLTYPGLRLNASGSGDDNDKIKVVIYSTSAYLPKDGGLIQDFNDISSTLWVRELFLKPGRFNWRGVFTENGVNYISINRELKAFNNLQELGVLSIMIPESNIRFTITHNNENMPGEIYFIDNNGSFITNSQKDERVSENIKRFLQIHSDSKEGLEYYSINQKKYILAYSTSDITGWKLVSLLPYTSITERVDTIKYVTFIILLAGILFSILITILIAHATTRRLDKMTRKIKKLQANWRAPLGIIAGNDEIGQLDRSFNELIKSLNELTDRESRYQVQKTSLQIELLQSQINPHILYNTLSTISWKAKKAGAMEVCSVTEQLIRFFKYYLNKGELISNIAQELEMIKQYLNILRFTYHMDFQEKIKMDNAVLTYSSINLILQPIVENSLIHGIKPSGRPGILEIEGMVIGTDICFVIRDNGVGMEQDVVERLNQGEIVNQSGGYGLVNVIKRIKLYFGENYGVQIRSFPGKGTEVTMKLPAYTVYELEQKLK